MRLNGGTRTALAIAGAGIGCAVAGRQIWRQQLRNRNSAIPRGQRIVVLGAGFGGLNAAQELARLLPFPENGQITLVDQNNFLLFTPMLSEVAGGELDPRHIVASPRQLSRRIHFQRGAVREIDLARKTVQLDIGIDAESLREIAADQLVIALGSVPNYHGIPGLREHSLGMKSVADAAAVRNRVLACLERANEEPDASLRRELLTFVVGGAGYTGVETMAALNDLARTSARAYRNIRNEEITMILIGPGGQLLTELPPELGQFARRKLAADGVQVRFDTKIVAAAANSITLAGGEKIAARTLVWAGGVAPNPLLGKLDCRRNKHGAMVVDSCCQVPDHPGVWALGDCAAVPHPDGKGSYAPTAQNATREGARVAQNIVAVMRGQHPQPFDFKTVGELALVGRRSAVAQIYGRRISGLPAWAMWRVIYLSKMPGMAQRTRILADWILDLMFGRSVAELPLARHSPVSSD